MSAREKTNRQLLDHLVLADDDPLQLFVQARVDLAQLVDGIDVIGGQRG